MGGDAIPYETILYDKQRPVLTLTLNRPDTLNAINPQMTAELHGALRAIILTGAGRGSLPGSARRRLPSRALRAQIGAEALR
jgi:hypothetical protein